MALRPTATPRELLARWIDDACGGSKAEAARRIGCDPSYLTHLLNDSKRRVGLDFAVGLERATATWRGGVIRPHLWVPEDAAKVEG